MSVESNYLNFLNFKKAMTKVKIPDFKTLEESAEYWDTHSFADHIDETEPVEIEVQLEGHKLILDIDNDLSDNGRNCQEEKTEL